MSEDFYTKWLNVPAGERPPDSYALLGLATFCDDQEALEAAAQSQLARLDKYALNSDPKIRSKCQEMMNEVARARTMLAPHRKATYDEQLRTRYFGEQSAVADIPNEAPQETQAVELEAAAYLEDLASAAAAAPVHFRRSRKRRRSANRWPLYFAASIALIVIACVAYWGINRDSGPSPVAARSTEVAPAHVANRPAVAVPAKPSPLNNVPATPSGPAHLAIAPAEKPARDAIAFANSLGMKFVRINPGKFIMGSPPNEEGHQPDETQHIVTLTRPWFMGVHHVTQGQFHAFVTATGYTTDAERAGTGKTWLEPGFVQRGDEPVVAVSWNDAVAFIQWLNGNRPTAKYRLPTEAEWEYACRATSTSPFNTGDTIRTDLANYDGTATYGRGAAGIFRRRTTPVDSFPPNIWGLYDMHGNAWQWCQDPYAPYPNGMVTDPGAAEQSPSAVHALRGGSWGSDPAFCRSAFRDRRQPGYASSFTGFRICLDVDSSATDTAVAKRPEGDPLTAPVKTPAAGPTTAGGPPVPPATAPPGVPGRVVDLIPLIDVAKDNVYSEGVWSKGADGLEFDGSGFGPIRIPYHPPAEYDYQVELTPRHLRGALDMLFPCRGHAMAAFLSHDGKFAFFVFGTQRQQARATGDFLEEGKRCRVVVQVREESITVLLNEKVVSQGRVDPLQLRMAQPYIGENVLGFISPGSSVVFHKMEVVEWKGRGEIAERPLAGEPPPLAKPPPNEKPTRVVDLMPLIDPEVDTVKFGVFTLGGWERSGKELRTDPKLSEHILRIRFQPPEEYDFRVVFTRTGGHQGISQVLSHGGHSFLFRFGNQRCGCGLDKVGRSSAPGVGMVPPQENPTEILSPEILSTGRKYTCVVHVRKGSVAASIDGKLVLEYKTDYSELTMPLVSAGPANQMAWPIGDGLLGISSDYSTAIFHSIEVAEITGEGKSLVGLASTNPAPATPAPTNLASTNPAPATPQPVESRVREMVFVCDASGSMIRKMPILQEMLNKAIAKLSADQFFNIISFQGNKIERMSKANYVAATAAGKAKAALFIDGVTCSDSSDPIPAIQAAVKIHPEEIYLLTAGGFADPDALLKQIRNLNKDKKITFNTVGFIADDAAHAAVLDSLKTIASENGGTFKHVDDR